MMTKLTLLAILTHKGIIGNMGDFLTMIEGINYNGVYVSLTKRYLIARARIEIIAKKAGLTNYKWSHLILSDDKNEFIRGGTHDA